MLILGVDPSGNYYEGYGTTGLAYFDPKQNRFIDILEIAAENYDTQQRYWDMIISQVKELHRGDILSFEEYPLYEHKAKSQAHSQLETPQLIGVMKYICYKRNVRFLGRNASIAKRRWTNEIMEHKGYIYKKGRHWYATGLDVQLVSHTLDAMRHALHCAHFEKNKEYPYV